MLGLVQYDSDEEEDQQQETPPPPAEDKVPLSTRDVAIPVIRVKPATSSDATAIAVESAPATALPVSSPPPVQGPPSAAPTQDESADTFGPMRPPAAADLSSYPPSDDGNASEAPEPLLSPYSHARSLLRSYTIPTLAPDFSIPDSPPGSPPPGTTKQFASFLELKKKKVHFNQKLAQTTALRNPNLLENLMGHVGMDAADQYASNWNKAAWNPDPAVLAAGIDRRRGESAVQALARLQKEGFERRQADRQSVEFVSGGGNTASAEKSGNAGGKAAQVVPMSAAERVMSGLDRDRKGSPAAPKRDGQGPNRRDDDRDRDRDKDRDRDRNRHREDGRRDRHREEPERYKRQRSRSRERSRDRQKYRERDYGRR
ncbi:hypothetical protein DRE_04531 [Drechslerella stenobrocha 248]|uniref:HCNGP-like protein n=1 Tax=Drechslerella stenobrocha 248 TaxID=1043628 RepID=W7I1P0_9PEZI|nr:hypothetical protein DRE_04531 [Drechslerella stenobrocha 248]